MNKANLLRISAYIRNFMFILVNKEFLIFLFFLALSGGFWLMMTLNETYESEIKVPIRLTNVPKKVIVTSGMDDTISVTVKDKGFVLFTYATSKVVNPIVVDFETYSSGRKEGYGVISSTELQRQLSQQLYGSSKIVSIKPDKFEFYYNYGSSKKVPVKMLGRVIPDQSYYLANVRFKPDSVTVFATRKILDSIKCVYTQNLNIVNFTDTLIRNISLKQIRGAKCMPNTVRITIFPDVLTEEMMEIPITAENVPDGKVLRMFPSRVNVNFVIGASMFRSIRPENFKVVADYNELIEHPSDKCNLYLRMMPRGVKRAKLMVQKVDYLIEQQ